MSKIDLLDGKYTVIHNNGNNFKALRYGEEWRDLTGDGLVLALVQRIEELGLELDSAYGLLHVWESEQIDNILKDDPMFKDGK